MLVGEQVGAGDYDTDLKAAADFDSVADVRRSVATDRSFNTGGLLARRCRAGQAIDNCAPHISVTGAHRAAEVAVSSDRGVWVRIE